MLDMCVRLLLQSVRGSQKNAGKRRSEPDRAHLYKSLNNNIISLLGMQHGVAAPPDDSNSVNARVSSDERGILMTSISNNITEVMYDYVWLSRCCNNATAIADCFNGMHLAGIIACKSFALLCDSQAPVPSTVMASSTICTLFPTYPTIHVCHNMISELCYSELVFVLTNLQLKWDVLITLDIVASGRALVCCMARFGLLAAMQWPGAVLDDMQERDNAYINALEHCGNAVGSAKASNHLWVMSKRSIRHFTSTFLCMIREMAIRHASTCISVENMGRAEYCTFTTEEVTAYGFKLSPDTCDGIRTCFYKIKSIREADRLGACTAVCVSEDVATGLASSDEVTVPNAAREMPSTEKTWDFLLKKLGSHKLGPRPRKMNAEFTTLLSDVIVSLSDKYNHPGNSTVTRSCLNIIQTALKFYYVVPSAERFRDIVLMQNLCPGQRLNYAFDYMHFDTGQLSQVIYLHNLQFKQSVPPTTVLDWKDDSPAGPIAAFLQLITDLELWLQDSDDPLGILGDTLQIRRPLDRNKEVADLAGSGATEADNSTPDTKQKVRKRVRAQALHTHSAAETKKAPSCTTALVYMCIFLRLCRELERNRVRGIGSPFPASILTRKSCLIQYNETCCLVINKTDAYLVDRRHVTIFHAHKKRVFAEFHPALALLVIYARRNKLMDSMASVAINALKLASNAAAPAHT